MDDTSSSNQDPSASQTPQPMVVYSDQDTNSPQPVEKDDSQSVTQIPTSPISPETPQLNPPIQTPQTTPSIQDLNLDSGNVSAPEVQPPHDTQISQKGSQVFRNVGIILMIISIAVLVLQIFL